MKRILSFIAAALIAVSTTSALAQPGGAAAAGANLAESERVIAFPGAEGGGMYTSGARGALDDGSQIEVYHVTNLNDSGEGSFRDAVSKGNRIVVFDVSGNIELDSNVSISKDNITVLGQTAPGDGICFSDNNIKVGADNVILRYLRFRVGDKDKNGNDTRAQDGMEVTDNCENVIIDHCSVSWGTDENLSAYAVKDVTIQWSIIAEALNQSVHDKGEHSYAAIWGGVNLSVHHNIIATHKSRNPKIGTSETVAMTEGYTDDQTLVDMRNNIIYNWGDKAGYGTENGAKTYIINNIYKPGPATPAGKRSRIFELSIGNKYKENYIGSVYAVGNKIDVESNDSDYANAQKVNANNWQDDLHTGVYVDTKYASLVDKSNMVITEPNAAYKEYEAVYPITTQSAEEAYAAVIEGAGATLPKRDAVDERVISNVINRTAPTGSKGSVGLVDSPIDGMNSDPQNKDLYNSKGYPVYNSAPAPLDSDGDGIPDEWEDKMGLNKSNPNDSTNIGPDGYTWLEIYVEEALTKGQDADVSVAVEPIDEIVTNEASVELTARVDGGTAAEIEAASGETKILSYSNGIVSVNMGDGFTGGVAAAASYNADGTVSDVKSADVNLKTGTANVGEVQGGEKTKVFLWNNLNDMLPLCEEFEPSDVPSLAEIQKVQFYCNDKMVGETSSISGGKAAVTVTGLATGDNNIVAKAVKSDGTYTLSAPEQLLVIGTQNADGWTSAGGAAYDGECFTLQTGSELSRDINGDFKLVIAVDQVSNRASGVKTGISVSNANCGAEIGKWFSPEFAEQVYFNESTSGNAQVYSGAGSNAYKYSLFEIERIGNTLKLYAGTSLADLENNFVAQTAITGDSLTVKAAVSGSELTVSKLSMLRAITEKTYPQTEIVNISENDRLDLINSSIDVKITPDSSKTIAVDKVWVYLDSKPIGFKDVNITAQQTINIPLSFTSPQKGTITVYCFDENLGKATDSVNVVISQDGAPWILGDVGYVQGQAQTYAQVTDDYTFKIYSAPGGNISGSADRFGYMYQQFEGNNRMYYRSRLQSSKQFGVVFRNDLDADGVAYYFGGNTDSSGAVKYQLMARTAKGGEMTEVADVTDAVSSNKNLFFIAEKAGDMINIYQTENGATVYTTKTLVASVKAEGLSDKYYMGYGVTGENEGDFADSGWVGLENIASSVESGEFNVSSWNFNNGLDWMWQMQEKNVLRPSWTTETVSGNSSGKMKISTTGDYTSERYVFHEYSVGESATNVISASADVLMSDNEAGLNAYVQVKGGSNAFKVCFAGDGYLYIGDVKTEYAYDAMKWYHISAVCDTGVNADVAKITVTDSSGNVCAELDNVPSVTFREQKNVEKKIPITNAVYFESTGEKTSVYYIDNVSVDVRESSVKKNVLDSHFWNFSTDEFADLTVLAGGQTYSGLGVITGAKIEGSSKEIDGVSFSKRYRIGSGGSTNNKCVYFDVPAGTTDITVYAASDNSSETRKVAINDGTEYATGVTSAGAAVKLTHDGASARIYVYGKEGVSIYGINFETYEYVQ